MITAACSYEKPVKQAAVPPRPRPAAAPTPEEKPLILAQTDIQLPAAQPVPPESLPPRGPLVAKTQEPGDQAVNTQRKPAGSRALAGSIPSLAETPPQEPPKLAEEPKPAEEPARSRILPLPRRSSRSPEEVQTRLNAVRSMLGRIRQKPLGADAKSAAHRIESFARLCDQSLQRGDVRQANNLCDRAFVMAQDLLGAR